MLAGLGSTLSLSLSPHLPSSLGFCPSFTPPLIIAPADQSTTSLWSWKGWNQERQWKRERGWERNLLILLLSSSHSWLSPGWGVWHLTAPVINRGKCHWYSLCLADFFTSLGHISFQTVIHASRQSINIYAIIHFQSFSKGVKSQALFVDRHISYSYLTVP